MNKIIMRLFVLFLVLVMVTTFTGCGQEKIELNSDNCETYLNIKGSHDFSGNKYNANGMAVDAYDSYTFYANCEGVDGYDFENTKVTLQYYKAESI